MPQTIQIVFVPNTTNTYNNELIIQVGTESETIELKGIGMNEHKKYLVPFASQLIPEFISELHPLYKSIIEEFFKFLEQKSSSSYYDIEENWSLYNNIMNIFLFNDNQAIPVEHTKLFEKMFNDYANTFDFTNLIISLDDEKLRKLGLNSNIISRLSCTWKAYNFYLAAVNEYFVSGIKKNITLTAYYKTYNDDTNPGVFSSLDEDEVILTELPIYKLNTDATDIEQDTNIIAAPNNYKGKYPFQYQILSKSSIFSNGAFVNNLESNCNPAGFFVDFLYVPPNIRNAVCYVAGMSFPKAIININTIEMQTETADYSSINYPLNYNNNVDTTIVITKSSANLIRVHFDDFITENVDYVYIYDSTDTEYISYSGNLGDFNGVFVTGDTIKVRFVSNSSITAKGWHIDRIDWYE